MKKLLLASIFAACAIGVYAASDFSVTVTNSMKVLPMRAALEPAAWAVGTSYGQGAYVKNAGRAYMSLNAGTSGVAAASGPSHGAGVNQPAGQSIVWVAVESTSRSGIFIQQNLTTGLVSITYGAANGVGTGRVIGASSTYSDGTGWQGEVWVNATNSTINVSDW